MGQISILFPVAPLLGLMEVDFLHLGHFGQHLGLMDPNLPPKAPLVLLAAHLGLMEVVFLRLVQEVKRLHQILMVTGPLVNHHWVFQHKVSWCQDL